MPVSFDLAALEAGIADTRFAGRVRHFPCVTSTNALALEAARQGPAGTVNGQVWVADEQTAGRGRSGHTWHSAPGDGLYISAVVLHYLPMHVALKLALAAGLAARAAVAEAAGTDADLRWPNDLMIADRKCGGILVETAAARGEAGTTPRYAVIGIGINLNHREFPAELSTATSLWMEGGATVAREPLLAALLQKLDAEIQLLERQGETDLLARFAAASTWVRGKRVRVGEGEGYTGVTCGLDAGGFLLVQGDDGEQHTVFSGGVRSL